MQERILIIDDAVDSWQLLSSILRTHGYQPFWAPDGFHALNAARTHQPHVILLDLGLPAGDGFVVLQRLKRHRVLSAIPVIVVTVRDPAEAERQARKAGAIAFLQKPVKADELIATVRNVLAEARVADQPDRRSA